MYYTHEYNEEEEFESLEQCQDDLSKNIEWEEVADNLEIGIGDIIIKFCRRPNDSSFITWLEDKIYTAEQQAMEDLIFVHDEEDTALDE